MMDEHVHLKSQQYIIYSTHSLLRAFDHRSNDSAREDVMPLIPGNNMEMLSGSICQSVDSTSRLDE